MRNSDKIRWQEACCSFLFWISGCQSVLRGPRGVREIIFISALYVRQETSVLHIHKTCLARIMLQHSVYSVGYNIQAFVLCGFPNLGFIVFAADRTAVSVTVMDYLTVFLNF